MYEHLELKKQYWTKSYFREIKFVMSTSRGDNTTRNFGPDWQHCAGQLQGQWTI